MIDKRNIFKTWTTPNKKRITEFTKGFLLMASLCVITHLILPKLSNSSWQLLDELSLNKLMHSVYYDLNSVVFEELIFRGVPLYLLVRHLSSGCGILISASLFGIYHWFTNGVLDNVPAMLLVFVVTGFMGYVFAISYVKTKSIILPLGLHLGWNLTNHNIFSNGPNGVMIFEAIGQTELSNSNQLVAFIMYAIVIVIALFFVKSKFITEQKSTIANNVKK